MKMNIFLILSPFLFFTIPGSSQLSLTNGAWSSTDGVKQHILLLQDGYFTSTQYQGNHFIDTWGGPVTINETTLSILVEFNSANPGEVGSSRALEFNREKDQLKIPGIPTPFRQIDNSNAPLSGAWKISARKQDGNIVAIHQKGTRKTLKLLTGTRFQWIAIDPGTKEFAGTGGGTYTFENNAYTENIQFFSRDSSRVGSSLSFKGAIENGQWHHSGLSSKGEPIYEIWEKVKHQ